MANQAPQPMANESQCEYVVRAHRELMAAIPDAHSRNQVVWDAWDASFGNTERDLAEQDFPPERFDRRPAVCYFPEHETASMGPDGSPVIRRYDVTRLAQIADENNGRIRERRAYPTLVDRHTRPPSELPGGRDPDPPKTLGAVGPFRIGMIGRDQPVFSLFADEYARKDAAQTLAERPGRSVEVLTLKANGRSYINPIAAISEAPRLPIPLQFSMHDSGDGVLERYSAMAPASAALPGGGNTYVQRFGADPSPSSDGTEPENSQQETPTMALSDDDIRQVVGALMNTPPFQWVMQQMQGSQPGTPGDAAAPGGAPGAGVTPGAPGAGQPSPQAPPLTQDQNSMGGVAPPMRYSAEDEEDQAMIDRYQAMMESQQELIGELAETRGRLVTLERERTDAVRDNQLRDVHARFPHFVDLDDERNRCLYSAGSSMADADFESHLTMVEQYAARTAHVTPMIPAGDDVYRPGQDADTNRYAAEEAALIRKLGAEYVNKEEMRTYEELRTEARAKLRGTAS